MVVVLALREPRLRISRRNELPERIAQRKALRRCTRRYCSQREQFHHLCSPAGSFDAEFLHPLALVVGNGL